MADGTDGTRGFAPPFPPYPGGFPSGMPHPNHQQSYPPGYYPPHYFPPIPHHSESVLIPDPDEPPPIEFLPEPAPEPTPAPPHFNYGGYYWVDSNTWRGVYSTSVMGGVDQDGTQIYVGRAFHDGDWIPAKVIPEKSIAYIAYNGEEVPVHQFQVLCEQRFDWVPCSGGDVPANAVIGGKTSDGEHLYIGRVEHEGSNTVGKVHPSHGNLYIPFDGKEVAYADYEILVLR